MGAHRGALFLVADYEVATVADIAERFGAEFSEAERAKQIADGILTVAGPVPTIEGLPSREAW